MIKKILKTIVLILALIGLILGIVKSIEKTIPRNNQKKVYEKVFGTIQQKEAEILSFYTYGKAFNLTGKVENVKKDNFESARLVITDGKEYEKVYKLNYKFEDGNLIFSTDDEINTGIILDDLEVRKILFVI